MSLHDQLRRRQEDRNPIRVGVIGAGKFGSMFLSQAIRIPGVHVAGIADLAPDVARSNLALVGWEAGRFSASSLDDALKTGTTHVGDNGAALIANPAVDIIVECTGNPVVATDHLCSAFDAGKHVVSATVEADAVCGAALAARAKQAGVIYSMAFGDQPAMVCDLVDWARTCGFEVVAAGRGHKWCPQYRFSTPDTVWDHWGLTREQAENGRLNPKMFNSFLDGTKPAIEAAAIANACGLSVPQDGLQYPSGAIADIPNLMRPRAEGGVLDTAGMVEVISSQRADGSEIADDIRMGVWVCIRAADDYQRDCFAEYKVVTDDSGRYASLYRRWHMIGLELGMSVANVGIRGEATGTATGFGADVVAVAKRDLKTGEILDGEGGYSVAGQLRPASVSVPMRALPLGLTGNVRLVRDVASDAILTYDDVVLDDTLTAVKLRGEMERRHHGDTIGDA
ncbi:MAG: flagellar biosynthesis protein FlgA [Rhizobiaceae bacterium]